MTTYLATCFVCAIALGILIKIEPEPNKETPIITLISFVVISIPLIPIALALFFFTKLIRK